MQKIRLIKTGEIIEVENNIAHGMIERNEAVLVKKAFEYAPKDKMISEKRLKIRKK